MIIKRKLVCEIGIVDGQDQGSAPYGDTDITAEEIVQGDQGVSGVIKSLQVGLQVANVANHTRSFIPRVGGETVVIQNGNDRI